MSNLNQERVLLQIKEALAVIQNSVKTVEESMAVVELDNIEPRVRPANAGRPWTPNDEKRLVRDYKNGLTVVELCEKYERTFGGIQSRLLKFARFDSHKASVKGKPGLSENFSCIGCDKSIPVARIKALLGKVRCTQCQEEHEHKEENY